MDTASPLQAFLTSHSPVVLRELDGDQLFVLRDRCDRHEAISVGSDDDAQGTIRLFPDAFLAPSVLVNEGATEVGFVRGIDLYRVDQGFPSIASFGTALVNVGGGHPDKAYARAAAFQRLGYRVAVVRDDDVRPSAEPEKTFVDAGGEIFSCLAGGALEDDSFLSLSHKGVAALLDRAIDLHGEEAVGAHIESASNGRARLDRILAQIEFYEEVSEESRRILATASQSKKSPWFKNVGDMEDVAREIIGPDLERAEKGFREFVEDIFQWASKKSD
jgi:putative ATP-dependent endonuclease of the OLD family